MVQTIEEIAELLKTLKLDTEVSNQETEKVLASINSKMESIADDYAANQLLKDYLVDLRKEFDVRHDFNASKYNEFEKAFNFINETINQRLDSNLQYAADRFDNLNISIGKVNEDVSAKLDDISFDFHQKADENVDNITSALNVVSTKLDFVNNYLAEDVPTNFVALKEMNENLRDFVNEIGEAYKMEGQILEGKLSTRLFELEKSFVENVDRYYEKLSELKADAENFNNEFREVLNGKTDGIVFALEPLKNSIQTVLECDLSSNLTALKEQLGEVYSNVTTSMQLNLSQNQALVEGLEKLYNDVIEKINSVDVALNSQSQSNLELIRNAMGEIQQNIVANLNGGAQIVEDFRPLLVSIEEKMERLSSTCAGALANVAVDVTNALNTKLENIIEDLKNHIGLPVSANDLVFTVDNLKAELAVKFSELEGKQSTKEEDIATKEAIAQILNQLNLKIEELGIRYSNDEFNEILGANKAHIISGLKDLKNIILIAMKEVAKSSADSMDALHEKVDVLLQAGTDVELHNKINEIDAKTAAILEKIDTPDVVDETVDAQNALNSKLDTVYETNEKNAQALTYIYEKVDELVHSEDHVANTLMTVAEKFSGVRQNSEQLTNEIQGVVETVETINIRGEGVASAVNDINAKTNDIVETVNVVSDKIDTLVASDEHISYTLDLLSDKIDNNETTEQLTQGMQYLNEKMDSLNENDDRISRTIDVVLDKIETFSVSDDEIANSINQVNQKIETVGNVSEKLTDKIEVLSEKIDFVAQNDERFAQAFDLIADKVDILTSDNSKDQLISHLEELNDKATEAAEGRDKIAQTVDTINERTEILTIHSEKIGQVLDEIGSKTDAMGEDNNRFVQEIEGLRGNISDVGSIVSQSLGTVAGGLSNNVQRLGTTLYELSAKVSENDEQIVSSVQNIEEKLDATNDYSGKIVDAMEGLSNKIDTFSIIDDELLRKTSDIIEKTDSIAVISDQMTGVLNNVSQRVNEIQNVGSAVDKVADFTKNIASALGNVSEQIEKKEQDVRQTLAEFGQKFDEFAQNDNTIVRTVEELSEKIDVFKYNSNNDHIVSSLDALHEKTADCYASEEKLTEAIDVISAKIDTFAEADDRIHDTLVDLSDKIDVVKLETNNEHIELTLQALQDKVIALSERDVFEGFDVEGEIKNIKSLISAQRKYLEDTEISDRTIAMDDCLQDLQKKIDNIAETALSEKDLNANADVIKEELMAAIANVFEQISFIEETEEIKGFVEEKTDEISQHIKDVQHQLRQIASNTGDENYSYSLQDVETDIAKLRMILNDISDAAPNEELNQLSDNVSKIENTVKDLQTTLTQEEFARFKADFDKINEDIVSISTRTNTLLLNSDNSYKSLSEGLAAFKGMVHNLNEKVNYLDNTEIQKRIERKISSINEAMISSANSNKVIREVLMYLGEWMDTTTENINSLSEKTNEITDIQSALSELKSCVPDKSNLFKVIEEKFEEQQERIDRLEMKLERVISTLEETDDTKLNKKVDKIERLINKLNDNVEKLASYVDEE